MKFKKYLVLFTTALFLFCGAGFISVKQAKADDIKYTISNIWDNQTGKAKISYVEGHNFAKMSFEQNQYLSFKNTLAFKEFELVFSPSQSAFEDLNFEFKSDPPESSAQTSILNNVVFSNNGTQISAKLNDGQDKVTIDDLSADITITVTGGNVLINGQNLGELKEIKKPAATLKIENKGSITTELSVTKINGQELEVENSSLNIVSEDVKPIIILHDELDSGSFYIPFGLKYSIDFDAYDVLSSNLSTSVIYRKQGSTEEKKSTNKTFTVVRLENKVDGDKYEIEIEAKDANNLTEKTPTYTVDVKHDTDAPVLTSDNAYLSEYQDRVEKAAFTDFDEKKYVDLGSGEYYYIPNFAKMFEDQSSYKNMKFNLEYNTPSATGRKSSKLSASSLKIELTAVGRYSFKIQAIDQMGNVSQYSDLFTFDVENTSGPRIKAPTNTDIAYINSSYTSNSFEIKGVGLTTTYELEYRKDASQEFESTDETLSGTTFTPTKLGEYRIVVKTYDISGMFAKSETLISVEKKAKVIRGEYNWAKDNVLSIVFLCTGSLSLLGIIALLLIKPADDKIEVIESKPKKTNKK